MSVKIIGTGSALPAKIVTNEDLAQMVETSDEWIRERTGIGSRHISTGETVVSLAAQACRKALENAGREAMDVELLLVATCTPEQGIPCAACQVQNLLGATGAAAFDLNAACAGFLFALHTAWAYIQAGIYNNALIVGSEVLSKIIDWTDRGTCVLFGDGAGAVLVERSGQPGILGLAQHSDGARGGSFNATAGNCGIPMYSCRASLIMYRWMAGRYSPLPCVRFRPVSRRYWVRRGLPRRMWICMCFIRPTDASLKA